MPDRQRQRRDLDAKRLENISTNAFVGLDEQLDLRQRSNLLELDKHLHALWSLGKNFILGWAPRKGNLTMYFMTNFDNHKDVMDKLGKYSLGKSCLYAKKLEDIELGPLKKLIKRTMKFDPKYAAS